MTRLSLISLLIGTLATCGQYREPRANCFSFIASTEDKDTCTFFQLGAPDRNSLAND